MPQESASINSYLKDLESVTGQTAAGVVLVVGLHPEA